MDIIMTINESVEKGRAARLHDTTRNLLEAVWADEWPRNGAVIDFGLRSQEHYEALYYGIRDGELRPEALDAALGKGVELTALARSARSNPHRNIVYRTDWDGLRDEDERDGGSECRGP
jgi:hypothetical protein